jgi:hypothetical protein
MIPPPHKLIASINIGHHPIPDAYHKKIYRNEFQKQTQAIEPEPVQHSQRQNQTDMNDK